MNAGRKVILDRRRDQLESDIKGALNFLRGKDLVLRLMMAADSYAAKCCEAAAPGAAEAECERIRQGLAALARRDQRFIYFGRDVAAVLDGEVGA